MCLEGQIGEAKATETCLFEVPQNQSDLGQSWHHGVEVIVQAGLGTVLAMGQAQMQLGVAEEEFNLEAHLVDVEHL